MTSEERAKKFALLEEFAEWAQSGSFTQSVYIETDYYSVDLGAFGEQEMSVSLEDEPEFEVCEIIDAHSPLDASEIAALVQELKADTPEAAPDLGAVLAEMVLSDNENEARLAVALQAVVSLAGQGVLTFGPPALPDTPQPWPGALVDGIDYTAEDFPMRYLPPPGFKWGSTTTAVDDPHHAHYAPVAEIQDKGWVLDKRGRVRWMVNAPDDQFEDGKRWKVYGTDRDGLPGARGYDGKSPARAIDQFGKIIKEDHVLAPYDMPNYNWNSTSDADLAEQLLRERLQEKKVTPPGQFAPPAPVSV